MKIMKNKKILTRLLAVLATLLLVGALSLPCFANMQGGSTGEFLPVLGNISSDPITLQDGSTFDVDGFYKYVINAVFEVDQDELTLWEGNAGDCCLISPNGLAYSPTKVRLVYSGSYYKVEITHSGTVVTSNAKVTDGAPLIMYLRDYPPTYNVPENTNYWWKIAEYMEVYYVEPDTTDEPATGGWYSEIYNIVKDAVFGADATLDASQSFVLTQIATWFSYGLILLPFIVIAIVLFRLFFR